MPKTYLGGAEEERGRVPGCTGALLEIVEIERGRTSERSKNPGLKKYTVQMKVIEPKEIAGMMIWDHRCVVGTPEDPKAVRPESWKKQEGGAARLKRLLVRSGTPITDDDAEWMEQAEGQRVIAPIVEDASGEFPSAPGLYYREGDDDAPAIGLANGEDVRGRRRAAKGPAAAARKARAARAQVKEEPEVDEEEEDEKVSDLGDEEEEEPPKAAASPAKKKAPAPQPAQKKKPKPEEDDEDDDDEDEED